MKQDIKIERKLNEYIEKYAIRDLIQKKLRFKL